jgi:uncharacterized protein
MSRKLHIATVATLNFATFLAGGANAMLLYFTQASPLERVVAFFLAWVGCWLPLAIAIAILVKWHPPQPLTAAQKLPLLASLYLIALPLLWVISLVEGVPFSQPFSHYGIPGRSSVLVSLGCGLCLALLSLAVIFALEGRLGWLEWQASNWQQLGSVWLPILLLGLWIGVTEELIFRGFLLNELIGKQKFNELLAIATGILAKPQANLWLAAVISSLIFAFGHLVWEVKETIPQLPGLWLMGMVLVLARWVDGGNLGLAWGLHAGWVWGLTCIDTAGLIKYTGRGRDWLTGLAGKPLAGIAGVLCLLGTAVVLSIWDFRFEILRF